MSGKLYHSPLYITQHVTILCGTIYCSQPIYELTITWHAHLMNDIYNMKTPLCLWQITSPSHPTRPYVWHII